MAGCLKVWVMDLEAAQREFCGALFYMAKPAINTQSAPGFEDMATSIECAIHSLTTGRVREAAASFSRQILVPETDVNEIVQFLGDLALYEKIRNTDEPDFSGLRPAMLGAFLVHNILKQHTETN